MGLNGIRVNDGFAFNGDLSLPCRSEQMSGEVDGRSWRGCMGCGVRRVYGERHQDRKLLGVKKLSTQVMGLNLQVIEVLRVARAGVSNAFCLSGMGCRG